MKNLIESKSTSKWPKPSNHLQEFKNKSLYGDLVLRQSAKLLPIFKILTAMDFEQENLEMFAMSEEKIHHLILKKVLKFTMCRQLFFLKNGREINRFVESPVESVESDIKKIIKGEVYNHSYTL